MSKLADHLRRMGFSEDVIASAITPDGKPLAEVDKSKAKRPPMKHDLGDAFCELWRRISPGIPLEREYRFHPTRRWRFDVAFVEQKVAVEMEGGVWTRGRHTRPKGYKRDMEKYNAAAKLGWIVLRYSANDLEFSPVQVIEEVTTVLEAASAAGGSDV